MSTNLNIHSLNVHSLNCIRLNTIGLGGYTKNKDVFGGYVGGGLKYQFDCEKGISGTSWKMANGNVTLENQDLSGNPVAIELADDGGALEVLAVNESVTAKSVDVIEFCIKEPKEASIVSVVSIGDTSVGFSNIGSTGELIASITTEGKRYECGITINEGEVHSITYDIPSKKVYIGGVEYTLTYKEEEVEEQQSLGMILWFSGIEVYSVRAYSKVLTEEQMRTNMYIDIDRFILGKIDYSIDTEYVYLNTSGVLTKQTYISTSDLWDTAGADVAVIYNIPRERDSIYHLIGSSNDNTTLRKIYGRNYNVAVSRANVVAYRCTSLKYIDLSYINTSNVSSFNQSVAGCTSLEKVIGIENLDVSGATRIDSMFVNCYSLTTLDASKWNTENITTSNNMFSGCNSLISVGIPRIPSGCISTSTFNACTSLTTILECGKISSSLSFISSPLTPESIIKVLQALDTEIEDECVLTLKSGIVNPTDNPDVYEVLKPLYDNTNWSFIGIEIPSSWDE